MADCLVGAGRQIGSTLELENLRERVTQLTKAPLKPQQRMFFPRCRLLPSSAVSGIAEFLE